MADLEHTDKEILDLIKKETERQQHSLGLIPSENFVSKAVLEATGSIFTNKYSEGYPGKRYYGGNACVDDMETLAIERAKKLFCAEHVNVQPYSGSPGNLEIYSAFLNFNDKVMGMSLSHGGHLTHGHAVNFSGKAYKFVHYAVNKDTEMIDYDAVEELAIQEQPKLIVSGFTAYPREVDFKRFSEIAEKVGAISMADISHISGLIIGGVHQSPFPHTDVVMTTTHKTLRGPRGAMIMCKEKYATLIDKAVFPGMQGGPHNNSNAAKAVCFAEAMKPEFKEYARQIVSNAKALAAGLKNNGLRLVTGGTDTHLLLVDLRGTKCTGKVAELALDKVNITVNKNTVPYDTGTPFNPSGIRLGTPGLTTRGMKESEMKFISELIFKIIENPTDEAVSTKVKSDVIELCKRFPIPDY